MSTQEFPPIETKEDLLALLDADHLSRRYFLGKADERWLEWFRENGFFEALKDGGIIVPDEAADPAEINYLFRVAPKKPREVADIVCGFTVGETELDARAIWSLLWVSSRLPAPELARIAPKVRDEGWVDILQREHSTVFKHHGILTTLHEAGDNESLLTFAEAMLTLRPKECLRRASFIYQDPLCLTDLSCGDLFPHLAAVGDAHVGRALSLVLRTLGGIIDRRGTKGEDTAFGLFDNYFLADTDFFGAEMGGNREASHDNDAHKLAAALRLLAERFVNQSRSDPGRLAKFSSENVSTLPDSWAAWRVRLFFWGLAPGVFRVELRQALRRIFAHGGAPELAMSAEYLHALGKGFQALSRGDRRKFVKRSLGIAQPGPTGELVGHMLSMIHGDLTPDETRAAQDLGIAIDPRFAPVPTLGQLGREPGLARRPMEQDGLGKFPVPDIAAQMGTAWRPDALGKSEDGAWRTSLAYGLGYMLKKDVRQRPAEYAKHAALLFDRDRMDPGYTSACLEELCDVMRQNPEIRAQVDGEAIVDCCLAVTRSDRAAPLDRGDRADGGTGPPLAWWPSVLDAAAEIVRETLRGESGAALLRARRDDIIEVIAHLLSMRDPDLREWDGTPYPPGVLIPRGAVGEDPGEAAVNSIRGTALMALVVLAQQEAKHRTREGQERPARDIRALFEDTLEKTDTRAIMWVYGREFLFFLGLDKRWGMGLFDRIFPAEPGKRRLFEAAWQGYLDSAPSPAIRSNRRIQDLYRRGTQALGAMDPGGRPFELASSRLARQLAPFFLRCPEFGAGHPIFDSLWYEGVPGLRAEFVEKVGELAFREDAGHDETLARKLREFWDDTLEAGHPPEVLREFGHWINTRSGVIGVADLASLARRTLQATDGELSLGSRPEHSIVDLARGAPKETIEIIRHHLRWLARQDFFLLRFDSHSEWHQAIKALSSVPSLREEVRSLVDELAEADSRKFGPLREALAEPSPGTRTRLVKARTSGPNRKVAARDSTAKTKGSVKKRVPKTRVDRTRGTAQPAQKASPGR